ncbi:MAG: 3-carboxy-cis,cis-muconate cycloisomerase [Acidobacteriota bacterium]
MGATLLGALATTDALAEVFSDTSLLAAMLQFETALARVEARHGIVPVAAVRHMEAAADPGAFDLEALAQAARASGTVGVPFVEALRARVSRRDSASATYVHWGATSQDVTDTALILCLARARSLLAADHERLVRALRVLSDTHAATVMLARTIMQPAPPTTFGLKAAGWFAGCRRSWSRLEPAWDEALVVQFGGASGTLAVLGDAGASVMDELAREVGLSAPDAPWHAHRERLAALVATCGIYVTSLAKIARDVTLLMQGEVAEASEPGGGSSSMPHKRNPSGCAITLAAATRVPGLVSAYLAGASPEHERGVGGWHAEGPTIAAVVQATGSALAAMRGVVETLHVDPERMRANLAATRGVVHADGALALLARALGRDRAEPLIVEALHAAQTEGAGFVEALSAMPEVSAVVSSAELAALDRPERCLGSAETMRRRLLDAG